MAKNWSKQEKSLTLCSPRCALTQRRKVLSGKYAMTCENTSLPWCMAILCVGAQKMQSLTLDVQIETGPEIQNWQADHQLIESRRENVGTLLVSCINLTRLINVVP